MKKKSSLINYTIVIVIPEPSLKFQEHYKISSLLQTPVQRLLAIARSLFLFYSWGLKSSFARLPIYIYIYIYDNAKMAPETGTTDS